MMTRLMAGAAIGALMISAAAAQTPTPPANSTVTPPATSDQSKPADRPKMDDSRAAAPLGAASDKPQMVMSQKPDQWLASNFKGTDVVGADGKKIGDVGDILFDKDGKIDAYVISVGGFLGMGAKEVALAPQSFQVMPGDKAKGESDKLKLAITQDQLKQAENFARYQPPRPAVTTGAGPGGAPRPTNTAPTGR